MTYIVAELGHNHGGDVTTAIRLIQAAAECGVDAVKFQKRDIECLYTSEYLLRPYDSENAFGATYGAHRKALEFEKGEYCQLKKVADDCGVEMFATAFDPPSVEFCADLEFPYIKIASGSITNIPLLGCAASTGIHLIVSTGAATWQDTDRAYSFLRDRGNEIQPYRGFSFLHCVATYPSEVGHLNLSCIPKMKQRYPDIRIGFSNHFHSYPMAFAARLMGAEIIEAHFTLNRAWKGTDHAFSLEPGGLRRLVRDIHNYEAALGDGEKKVLAEEVSAVEKMGCSLRASRPLSAGTVLEYEDVCVRSPGGGIPPYELSRIVGRMVTKDMTQEEGFNWNGITADRVLRATLAG